uniref:Reverse transcriptase Ty1/copia-type domain-containing protein n=1 Tax=Peronospora matthiolae TaxID=2874970 RepID=A0AAV1U8H0_9STRA
MDLGTVKLILVLSRRWNVPARHGDVPNAYVKAEKEEHLDIYMKVPKGMSLGKKKELISLGVKPSSDLELLLKSPCMGLSKLGSCGANYLTPSCDKVGFSDA